MKNVFRTATRMAAPRLTAAGLAGAGKRSFDKAARWSRARAGAGPSAGVAHRTPLSSLILKGLGVALIALPIGFLLGRRLLGRDR